MRRFLASLFEIVEVALVAIVTVFLIRTFLFQPFLVSGASMDPNFRDGDYLLVDELTYRVRRPERGEVVVFRYPKEETTFFIKRIIGLPGERVEVAGGEVRVWSGMNQEEAVLREPYLGSTVTTAGNFEVTLGTDEYFVLGDNRSFSYDSRNWGAIKEWHIIGIARVRLWPLNDVRAFAAPHY